MNFHRAFLAANLERPVQGPVYCDAYIERWADVYLANPALRLLGVPFSTFLARPSAWLLAMGRILQRPLGEPARFPRRLEAAIAEAERAEGHGENGRLVVKIRHHAHPRRQGRDFLPTRQA